jgi:hypothetical protein
MAKRTVHFVVRRRFPGMVQSCALCAGPLLRMEKDPYDLGSMQVEGYFVLYCASCGHWFVMDEGQSDLFIDAQAWHEWPGPLRLGAN